MLYTHTYTTRITNLSLVNKLKLISKMQYFTCKQISRAKENDHFASSCCHLKIAFLKLPLQ